MKALEKDRTRRYDSASGLARDIARHLAVEPIEAAPPSARYRVSRFLRRHQVVVNTTISATLAWSMFIVALFPLPSLLMDVAPIVSESLAVSGAILTILLPSALAIVAFFLWRIDRGRFSLTNAVLGGLWFAILTTLGVWMFVGFMQQYRIDKRMSVYKTIDQQAEQYISEDRYEEAASLYAAKLQMRRDRLGDEDSKRRLVMKKLAAVRVQQGRYEDAEALFLEQLDVPQRAMRQDVQLLVELYEVWDKPEKAAKWRAKLPPPEKEGEEGDSPETETDSGADDNK